MIYDEAAENMKDSIPLVAVSVRQDLPMAIPIVESEPPKKETTKAESDDLSKIDL